MSPSSTEVTICLYFGAPKCASTEIKLIQQRYKKLVGTGRVLQK